MSFKLFLALICVTASIHFALAACSKKVVILPLFTGEANCSYAGWPSSDCGGLVKYIVQKCSFAVNDKQRDQIALLLPDYTQFTLCYLGTRGDCDSITISLNDVVLKPGKSFNIDANLDRLIANDVSGPCLDQSMGLIITDIPNGKLNDYPDVARMFRDNLNETIHKFQTKYFLHTVLYWLGQNMTLEEYWPPKELMNYKNNVFSNDTYFLELLTLNYTEFQNQASICDQIFPYIKHGSTGGSGGLSSSQKTGIIIGASVLGAIFLGLMIICIFRVRKRYIESKLEFFADQHAAGRAKRLFFGESRQMDAWEITPKELKVDADVILGTGISATVYKGHLKKKRDNQTIEIEVAVKFAHSYADSSVRKDMIREIEFMKTLGYHENLLIMVGCVKDPENPVIATEFASNGDLLKILRNHRLHYLTHEKCSDVDICLLLVDLLRIASQVCSGMKHLASLKYVHRDLAARNVMIMDDLTARVGDFGLCRLATESLYIQKGGKLPIKHMPFEALKFGEFSEKSDVWAFGVLLFEMFTGGGRPFENIETEELIKHLETGGRPELPEDVPEQLIRMLNTKCFDKSPGNRGTFAEIQEEIDRILEMFDI